MALLIRTGGPDDATGIAEVQVQGWKVAYRGIVPQSRLDEMTLEERTERWEAIFAADASGDVPLISKKLVAEDNGRIIGFAAFGGDRDRRHEPARGEVWSIYVHPDAWGAGAGYGLLQAAEEGLRLQGFESAALWVLEENDQARTFYERQGWRPDGTVQNIEIHDVDVPEVRYEVQLRG